MNALEAQVRGILSGQEVHSNSGGAAESHGSGGEIMHRHISHATLAP